LLSRCKWVPCSAAKGVLGDAGKDLDGLQGKLDKYNLDRQYVVVVVIEEADGSLSSFFDVGTSVPSATDVGPWLYVLDHGRERAPTRPGFNYNSLRPYRVSPDMPVPDHIAKPDYFTTGDPVAERRSEARNVPPILSAAQADSMRHACRIGREILDAAHRVVRPGVTTDEIDRVVHDATIAADAYPAPLHYVNFPKSVCTSVNEVVCHGIPDLRELEEGDIVNIDVSAIVNGYHADLNETFAVGQISKEKHDLIKATHDSLMKAIEACVPGMFYRDLGAIITKHVNGCGFQVDKTYCGHGIGEFFHCSPNIPHYAGNKAKYVMKPGHCFTIEPMINMGSWKDTHWPDGWTAVTKDGKPSAQFEHTLLCNETGVEILTARLPTSPPLCWEV